MPVFSDPAPIVDFYGTLFGVSGASLGSVAQFEIGLLDPSGVELSGGGYARQLKDAGSANWSTFDEASDCAGSTGSGVSKAGISNASEISFGTTTATWAFRYLAVYRKDTGAEIFRIQLDSTLTYAAGETVSIPAGGLKIASEYLQ